MPAPNLMATIEQWPTSDISSFTGNVWHACEVAGARRRDRWPEPRRTAAIQTSKPAITLFTCIQDTVAAKPRHACSIHAIEVFTALATKLFLATVPDESTFEVAVIASNLRFAFAAGLRWSLWNKATFALAVLAANSAVTLFSRRNDVISTFRHMYAFVFHALIFTMAKSTCDVSAAIPDGSTLKSFLEAVAMRSAVRDTVVIHARSKVAVATIDKSATIPDFSACEAKFAARCERVADWLAMNRSRNGWRKARFTAAARTAANASIALLSHIQNSIPTQIAPVVHASTERARATTHVFTSIEEESTIEAELLACPSGHARTIQAAVHSGWNGGNKALDAATIGPTAQTTVALFAAFENSISAKGSPGRTHPTRVILTNEARGARSTAHIFAPIVECPTLKST